jgi:hypothetical protein
LKLLNHAFHVFKLSLKHGELVFRKTTSVANLGHLLVKELSKLGLQETNTLVVEGFELCLEPFVFISDLVEV